MDLYEAEMITKIIFRKIVPILLSGLLLLGCTRELSTSFPVITLSPTVIFNIETSTETPWSTIEPTITTISSSQTPELELATITPSPSGSTQQLTFVSDNHRVFAIDVNCLESENPCLGEPKLLLNWKDWISEISWSPDGKRIAFISGEYGGIFYISDWNGENALQITDRCGAAHGPQWSLDGTKVAFIYAAGRPGCEMLGYYKIQIYDTRTSQITDIFNNVFDPSRIAWLPGGEFGYTAMKSNVDRTRLIDIVELDGRIIKQLPDNAEEFSDLLDITFSHDGRQMAFVGVINPNIGNTTADIYSGSVAGGQLINLTNGAGINLGPAWSPNLNWLAFESDRTGNYEIYLIQSDGTGLIQLTHDTTSWTDPAWRTTR